jgi:signal transduction histidine kinase
MRYRIEAEGGTMTVDSAPGRGTTIQATLPTAAAAMPAVADDVQA